jgi:hypothetical protein
VVTSNLPDLEHSLVDAKVNMEAIGRVSGGLRLPLLVDSRIPANITPEAKKYYAGEEAAKIVSACGILAAGVLTRVVANLIIPHTKQAMPMKLFNSENDAVHWLTGFLTPERRV